MSFKLGSVNKNQAYLLADLAELCLVVYYDKQVELSQAKFDQILKELPAVSDEEDLGAVGAVLTEQEVVDVRLADCWQQLEYRQAVFGDYYPFRVDGAILSWAAPPRTDKQCLYAFLLICSRLRSFGVSGFMQEAAKAFTKVSHAALANLAGPKAVVRIFDANSDDRQNYYGTNLRHAMVKLAGDLGAHATNLAEIQKLSTSGDQGLDLVAVYHFDDRASGSYAIFGQCGAQETEWVNKTLEAYPRKFQSLFTMLNAPDNLMFIPLSYRDATGAWVSAPRVSACLLIDRLRILRLIGDTVPAVKGIFMPVLQRAVEAVGPSV